MTTDLTTNFEVLCGVTVPVDYSWDSGRPLVGFTGKIPAYSTTTYISGYAPGLYVLMANTTRSESGFRAYDLYNYTWDFGDFYNQNSNTFSLSCPSVTEHLYVMPGIYNISLNVKAARTKGSSIIGDTLCRGKFEIRWNWGVMESGTTEQKTWNETTCEWLSSSVELARWTPKWWDDEGKCFQKYCKFWDWINLANLPGRANPVRWTDTGTDDVFEKKWMLENNETQCVNKDDFDYLNTEETEEQTKILIGVVEVKEIKPTAGMKCSPQPTTGQSPYTVVLSPFGSIPGSFPIDRIDWDLGDGTPIKTVTRYTSPTGTEFVHTNTYKDDINDVRNYNLIHTYYRTKDTYAVFYPSLTCYSANTNTWDACSTTVGPLFYPFANNDVVLLKVRNTLKGNLYTFDAQNQLTFLTNLAPKHNQQAQITQALIQEPPNRLSNTANIRLNSLGYAGTDYPLFLTPRCLEGLPGDSEEYLSTEDNNPRTEPVPPVVNTDEEGLPILTQRSFLIYP